MVNPATDLTAVQAGSQEDDGDQRCVILCLPTPRLEWVPSCQLHPAPHPAQVPHLKADAVCWLTASKEAARAAIINFQLRQLC